MNDLPIQMLDSDELITRDFIKGALFALAGVVICVCVGLAIYLKYRFFNH